LFLESVVGASGTATAIVLWSGESDDRPGDWEPL